ncbi:MAG: sensor histidine kinase [Candidatus Cloacimonadota bacterium]|nr:sensor histidine kinase [Candidatus Cloacimonadota bacterium]
MLDIIENSISAKAKLIQIEILVQVMRNKLVISIEDDGIGMDAETLQNAQDPFYTSKNQREKKIGLGIPLFKQNAEMCDGGFWLKSTPGVGTKIIAEFRYDHVDRMPLGNIADTILGSIIGHPEVDFVIKLYRIFLNGEKLSFEFDTRPIKKELEGVPLNHPEVYQLLQNEIKKGIIKTKMEEI